MDKSIDSQNDSSVTESPTQTPVMRRQSRPLKLESLPTEPKRQLDACIAKGWGAKRTKAYLLNLLPDQKQFLECSLSTYQAYINKHKEQIVQTEKLETRLRDASADPGNLKDLLTSGANPDQVRQALEALFTQCEARLRLIEIQRNKSPDDPRWESHFTAYVKEKRAILETLAALSKSNEATDKDISKQEFDRHTFALLDCVSEAHRRVYGEEKSVEFDNNLKAIISERLASLVRLV